MEKEGYNLNISRYVSTAEAKEEIDLGAVNLELTFGRAGLAIAAGMRARVALKAR